MVTEIRSKLAHLQRTFHRLWVEKYLSQQRVFVEAMLRAANNKMTEQNADTQSAIQGVEQIKIG